MVQRQALVRSAAGSTPDGVPFLYLSFVLLHHAKKSGARHFSSSHCCSAGRQASKATISVVQPTIIGVVRFAWRGAATTRTTQIVTALAPSKERKPQPSWEGHLRTKKMEVTLCLVCLKRVSIFDSIFRVGCLDPAKPWPRQKLTSFYHIIFITLSWSLYLTIFIHLLTHEGMRGGVRRGMRGWQMQHPLGGGEGECAHVPFILFS